MRQLTICIALLVMLQPWPVCTLRAQDYDFAGILTNYFTESLAEGNYTLKQSCGRMMAHNNDTIAEEANRGYFLKTGLPAFNESWSLSARVTIPFRAAGLMGGMPSDDAYAEIGIGCLFEGKVFSGGLQVQPPWAANQRLVLCEAFQNGKEFFDGQGDSPTSEESVTVSIRYDSASRLLRFYANGKLLMDLDIATDGQSNSTRELDWGMKADSLFQIAIFANSANYRIMPEVPLQLDDFSFHIDGKDSVDSPAVAIKRSAVELECSGQIGQQYEIQVSDNLTDWFTVRSFPGTGGISPIPVSAETKSLFYRIRP